MHALQLCMQICCILQLVYNLNLYIYILDADALLVSYFTVYSIEIQVFPRIVHCQGRQFGTHRFAEPSSRAGCH